MSEMPNFGDPDELAALKAKREEQATPEGVTRQDVLKAFEAEGVVNVTPDMM